MVILFLFGVFYAHLGLVIGMLSY